MAGCLPSLYVQTTRTGMNSETTLSEAVPRPYSSFSNWKKKYIVFTAAGAGFFSSLSAQIYFPALNALAEDLGVSSSLINLTVTSYMVNRKLFPEINTRMR